MKRYLKLHWKSFLKVAIHGVLLILFTTDANAASPSSRVTQSSISMTFIFTNGLIALVFLLIGWYFFKRS